MLGNDPAAPVPPPGEDAFYLALDEGRFHATGHTAGPWSPDAQHLGPPSALLVRALEHLPAAFDASLARVAVDILGPVPTGPVTVTAGVERPGRSLELVTAELSAGGRPAASARGWRIVRSDTSAVAVGDGDPLPPVTEGMPVERPAGWGAGYLDAMEWRWLSGGFAADGPARVWARQRIPLVAGEEPTPLQRLFTVADSGSGASRWLDPREWYFINCELTVHLHREPAGEWIGLDAATVIGPAGTGTASTVLHDREGQLGHGAQALLVRPR